MAVVTDRPPPPGVVDPGGGGGSPWVELVRARDDIDAHLLKGRLGEAGIETRFVKDRFAPGAWLYGGSNPWAPVTVLVRRLQLDEARLVLAEISFDAPPAEPAPRRGGSRRVPTLWWVTALGLGALLSIIVLLQTAQSMSICKALPFCSEAETNP
jgi:Putative prokaryotic signal transducing protein